MPKMTDHGPAPAPLALHAINARLEALEAELIASGGEITEEMEADYADLLDMRSDKMAGNRRSAKRNVAVIQRLRASANGTKAIADRLSDHAKRNRRSRSNARSADRVEERMLAAMLAREETRHDTPLGIVSVRRNSARPVELLADEEDLPERFLRRTTSVDKRELSDALKADDPEALAVARFGEAGHHLRIS